YAQHRAACAQANLAPPPEVPIMRTVFVTQNATTLEHVRGLLEKQLVQMRTQNGAIRRAVPERIEDWAIVGAPSQVAYEIERYRQRLGMTHLIATRLRIAGTEAAVFEDSLASLAELAGKEVLAA